MNFLIDLSGNRVWADDIEATGTTGVVIRVNEQRVRKIPKVWSLNETAAEEQRCDTDHQNKANKCSFESEARAYQRLGPCNQLVEAKVCNDGIYMERLRHDLATYLDEKPEPGDDIKAAWIESILLAVQHTHRKKILIDDIALRNFLLTDKLVLKMVDLGQCSIFPENIDMGTACDDQGVDVRTDIFHVGCALYSIATWKIFEYNLFDHAMVVPELSDLPDLDGVPFGDIIRNCWMKAYASMEVVVADWKRGL